MNFFIVIIHINVYINLFLFTDFRAIIGTRPFLLALFSRFQRSKSKQYLRWPEEINYKFYFFYYKSFQINLIILIRMIFNNTTLVFFLKYSIPGPVISASSHSADFSIVWIYKFYFSSNRAYFRIRVFIILGYISNSNSVFHQ